MSGFYGADTEQLRSHAQLLKDRAGTLEDLRERLDPLVMDESAWQGSDADAFREQWRGRTAGQFDRLSETLGERSGDLETHAEQQDEASTPQGENSDGFLDFLQDAFPFAKGLVDAVKGIALGGKKIWDALRNMKNPEKLLEKLRGMKGKIFDKVLDKLGSFDELMKKAPWLMKTGKVFGKLLPGLDILTGGWQMIDSIKSGDTFHAITGGVTTLGGVLITAGTICDMTGVGAVVGVPLQVIGGVLVGGAMIADGVKWAVDNWDTISETAGQAWDATTEVAADAWDGATDLASDAWDGATDAASDAWDGATDAASDAVDGLKDAAGGLKNALGF